MPWLNNNYYKFDSFLEQESLKWLSNCNLCCW